MVRLSGVRMTIGEEGVGEMGVGEMGLSEVETIIIMYNTYVLYPMFIYVISPFAIPNHSVYVKFEENQ